MCILKRCSAFFMGGIMFFVMGCLMMGFIVSTILSTIIEKNSYDGEIPAYLVKDGKYYCINHTIVYSPIYYFYVDNQNYTCYARS